MADHIQTKPASRTGDQPPLVVKKYANRRLYNTESSSYVSLDDLAGMVRHGRDFVVYDAKSGDDITHSVLTQIIVEEEAKGQNLLPTAFLRQLIGFYGNSMQGLVPKYLEQAMAAFSQQQEQMRSAMQKTMGNLFPLSNIEEFSRQNIAMMERAFSLFSLSPQSESEPKPHVEPSIGEPSEMKPSGDDRPGQAVGLTASAWTPEATAGVEALDVRTDELLAVAQRAAKAAKERGDEIDAILTKIQKVRAEVAPA